MKYINTDRTNEECLENVIKSCNGVKNEIKWAKELSIKEIRYIDNQYRIFNARKNWGMLIQDTIDNLL
tara:strand:+ start:27 stop:230 length:204 start_codon:yes stop_codon:yes gene_type:complete